MKIIIKDVKYKLIILLIGLFALTRVYRNSFNYHSTQQGGIWNIIIILFFFIYIYELIKMFHNKSYNKYKILSLVFFMLLLTSILFQKNSISFNIFYRSMMSLAFLYVIIVSFSYYKNSNSNDSYRIIRFVYLILLGLSSISLIMFRTNKLDFVMISISYYSLCLFPLVLRHSKMISTNKISVIYILQFICILISGKRTGLIALVIATICFYFIKAIQKKNIINFFKVILGISISLFLLIIIMSFLIDYFNLDILDRLLNIFNDGGSGRDVIYTTLTQTIKDSDLIGFLFGHGVLSVSNYVNVGSAHNDFIGMFFYYGLGVFIVFVIFYIFLFRDLYNMIRSNYVYASVFGFSLIISLFLSMFSNFFTEFEYSICMSIYIGVELSDWYKFNKAKK